MADAALSQPSELFSTLLCRAKINMARPTLLMAEVDPVQALSVRKLVLETAKFNVLTAHSPGETEELIGKFPKLDAVVLVNDPAFDCEVLARTIRKKLPKILIVEVTSFAGQHCSAADHHVSSHEPETLLELTRSLLGDPRNNSCDVKTQGAKPRPKR